MGDEAEDLFAGRVFAQACQRYEWDCPRSG